ncbi:proteinaceous RNase P 2 isoform X2 [Cornus florida]|uniref:proteinaceous RNase P 2 isoform X2 n=1 Tax=Cornus florida TaxID=4283 RepID=UPI0028A01C02|nr:proteinaceous RNase P 2 isoform X2 [Cornus florida]
MEVSNQSKHMKKNQTPEGKFRHILDLCSKNKDLSGAISLYESSISQKIRLSHHHFNALLYICSNSVTDSSSKNLAFDYGFRIFNHMLSDNISLTEATITAVARIAAAGGDGDLAFDLVKTMGTKYTLLPRLRSYDPALFCFCKNSDADKAYSVEEHMLSNGLQPEEPELAALLKVSVENRREQKVYAYLHKLRGSVRCVSESTMEIIEEWFVGTAASEVGMLNGDEDRVKEAILSNGGGWHGLGWLGKGEWVLRRTKVDLDGRCSSCAEQLVCVDINRGETEKFAQSVASLAMEREVQSNFRDFQDLLDKHAEYEAVVDGANIGLYQQNFADGGFSVSQLEAVVKELYERNNKWPLVILHNKRIRSLLESASNRELLEEWMVQGVLYGTPYGSNDDWYWLYAAVKLKCFLVTNDEMRDHIFELVGSSFFLKWKERHQESEKGTWHVPLAGECSDESPRRWLCITRPSSRGASGEASGNVKASETGQLTCNHRILNSCKSESTKSDQGVNGSSDSFESHVNTMTVVARKRKDRSPSPSSPDP